MMQERVERRTWSTLFLLSLLTSSQTSFSVVGIPFHAERVGYTAGELASLLGAFPLFAAIAAFASGPVSDFLGRKKMLTFGLSLLTISLGLHLFADHFSILLPLRALSGLATGMLLGLPSMLLSDSFVEKRQLSLLSKSLSGYAIGHTLGIPLGILLIGHFGFLELNAILGLVSAFVLIRSQSHIPSSEDRQYRHTYSNLRDYLYQAKQTIDPKFAQLLATGFLSFLATSIFFVGFTLTLYQNLHLLPHHLAPIYIIAGVLQFFILTKLIQKWRHIQAPTLAATSLAINAILYLAATFGTANLLLLATLFALALATTAMRIPPIQLIVNQYGSSKYKGLRMSLLQTANNLGKSLGSIGAGIAFSLVPAYELFLTAGILLIPCAAFYAVKMKRSQLNA